MNIDISKSNQIAEKILKIKKSKELQEVLDNFCKEIKYYDDKKNKPSNDLIDNVNYLKLKDYVADLTKVIMISNEIIMEIEEIDNFENRITDTKTDLLTYLENYVNDDTSHKNIRDYIEKDFDDIKEFLLSLAKGYFYNNFLEYLKNIDNLK
tara:strand:+ start:87 stop:542 length:456 start_codon:yes stop_codon:yes gene_type:complete